jgi:hypothetical protein
VKQIKAKTDPFGTHWDVKRCRYYVKNEFIVDYRGEAGKRKLFHFEVDVERSYTQLLDQNCRSEKHSRVQSIRRAQYYSNKNAEEAARKRELPHCNRLRDFRKQSRQ